MADDLLNFFTDINHKFQPVRTNRFIEERGPTDDFRSDTEEKNENEKAYAKKYEQEEAQNLRKRFLDARRRYLFDTDSSDDYWERMLCLKYHLIDENNEPYRTKTNKQLPIFQQRSEILDKIREHPVVVIVGNTGCGKTTQVPQYILEDSVKRRKRCNIIIAQPRRIAAQSNAERVTTERDLMPATLVGSQVGLDERTNLSDDTRILFCTTGILLEKLVRSAKTTTPFMNYTHVILDEVHERDKSMDFLLIVIKKLLNPSVKVILMSATIKAPKFAHYFETPVGEGMEPAPIIQIGKEGQYSVKTIYYDELEKLFKAINPNYVRNFKFSLNNPKIHEEEYDWVLRVIMLLERVDRRINETSRTPDPDYDNKPKPSILIFLPGINEINHMHRVLQNWTHANQETTVYLIVLHSMVSAQQNKLALMHINSNVRKIILATNIAESSITIPDVRYIFDFCRTKFMITDQKTNFSSLRLSWASHMNCDQRIGRAGRVSDGIYFGLVPKDFYMNEMSKECMSEMLSNPLENMILKTKLLDMGKPEQILALALDKPKLSSILQSVLMLKECGALLRTCGNAIASMDGDITFIGQIMADLPIDIRLSKLIIFGYCFSVLSECIVIAAALNCSRGILKQMAGYEITSYMNNLQFSNGSGSDLFAVLHAYNVWAQKRTNNDFGTLDDTSDSYRNMKKKEKEWADRYNLNISGLYECDAYIKEINHRLVRKGIKVYSGPDSVNWKSHEKMTILKVVIAGAFYPNYFFRTSNEERSAFQEINGLDPRNTVYFKQMPREVDRCLYVQSIKKYFVENKIVAEEDLNDVKVIFADGAEKVFVTFNNSHERKANEYGSALLPGQILPEVYMSIKANRLRKRCHIKIVDNRNLIDEIAETHRLTRTNNDSYIMRTHIRNIESYCVPRILDKTVEGAITHIEDCSRFWFQPSAMKNQLREFCEELNRPNTDIEQFDHPNDIKIGQIVAAPFEDGPNEITYYRAKVKKIIINEKTYSFKVQFFDFGNTQEYLFPLLKKLRGVSARFLDIPPRCFECRLAEVQPSILNAPTGKWSKESTQWFNAVTDCKQITAEVFSVVNGVAAVFIKRDSIDINKELVEKGFADVCEENYASRANNVARVQARNTNMDNLIDENLKRYLEEMNKPEMPAPADRLCSREISLLGPISSLETKLYSVMKVNSVNVGIDVASVNSVLLNNDPQDYSDKFLVAAAIGETSRGDLTLRYTTLMPNIRGFGPLMAMIFCPTMELKRDAVRNRFVKVLTGLGYDDSKNSAMFKQHDLEFDLDVEITREDFEIINQIRYNMDTLLYTEKGQKSANCFSETKKSLLARKIKECIVNLLQKTRTSVEKTNEAIAWNEYPAEDVIEPQWEDSYGNRSIFPLHRILRLKEVPVRHKMILTDNCKELHSLKSLASLGRKCMTCRLCNSVLENVPDIQHHVLSRLHMDREKQINFKL